MTLAKRLHMALGVVLTLTSLYCLVCYLVFQSERVTISGCRLVRLEGEVLTTDEQAGADWPLGRRMGVEYLLQETGAHLGHELLNGGPSRVFDADSDRRTMTLNELKARMAGRDSVKVETGDLTVVITLDETDPGLGTLYLHFDDGRFQATANLPLAKCIRL